MSTERSVLTAQEKPVDSRIRSRFTLFSLGGSLVDFSFGTVFVTILLGRGVEPWALGSTLAAVQILGQVLEAPSGALGDRYGHRRLLFLGQVLWGAGFIAFGVAGQLAASAVLPVTVVGLCLWACGFHLQSGTLTAIMVNRVGSRGRGSRIARIVRLEQVASRSGSMLGAASVMVAGAWVSADVMVLAGGVLLVVLALFTPLCFPVSPGQPGRAVTTILRESVVLIAGRRFAPLMSLAAASAVVMTVLVMSWQPLLLDAHGEDVRLNGLVMLVMTTALMAGAACSRFVDRLRPHVWGPVCAVAVGVPLVLVAFGVMPLIAGVAVAEFFLGVAGVQSGVWQQLMYSDANRNTMFSAMAVVSGITVAVTQLTFGWLWELAGISAAITVLAALSMVAASASLVLSRLFPESTTWHSVENTMEENA